MFDKFHDECGVVAIYGHPEASNLAYLGLYALQHRGQESAGICIAATATRSTPTSPWATWPISSRQHVLAQPARRARHRPHALLHRRRHRAAQRAAVLGGLQQGQGRRRAQRQHHQRRRAARATSERDGSIFQASSDTEVILHLVAHSRGAHARRRACAMRCCNWKARSRWCSWREDRIIVARDPHGFRPLAMGEMELSGGRKCYVFASETCAFDLIGAVYLHDVEPGEMVIVGPKGMTRERYAPRAGALRSASSSTSISRVPIPSCSAARCRNRARIWAGCWRASIPPMPTWWCPCPIPASPPPSAIPPNRAFRSARR